MFTADTYLTGTNSRLKRVCAHLIFSNATSEVFVAFSVADNWHVCNIEDGLISRPWKNSDKKAAASSMLRKGEEISLSLISMQRYFSLKF